MKGFAKCLAIMAMIWFGSVNAATTDTFQLTSSAAPPMGRIPTFNTCDGQNGSPPLAWTGVPANTQAFALIVSDPDATSGTFYHWVWFNIPNTTSQLPSAALPPVGTIVGNNSSNQLGYYGPCPPPGHLHHYIFTLYALNAPVALSSGSDAGTVLGAIQPHVIGTAQYVMTYNR
ncbi:MAG: YbhB/YbcL family Raf kinase inhibitor-like protein [Pseudomonadota bacterium]